MSDLRFPIGPFKFDRHATDDDRLRYIDDIARTPERLRLAIDGLDDAQLDTPYRPEGWTVRQVVHHLPDSHLNSYCRFKLALTEESPTIKPYDESLWAALPDSAAPVDPSLLLLEGLHRRWVLLLESLTPEQWERRFTHPEHGRTFTLNWAVALYSWHGRHHVAHITELRKRMGWEA